MPHLSAAVASFWIVRSIVSVSDAPGTACWVVRSTWTSRPVASRSTSSCPYVPRSSYSNVDSTPVLPIRSSAR